MTNEPKGGLKHGAAKFFGRPMPHSQMKRIILILIVCLMFLIKAEAIDISVEGVWNEAIDESDLVAEAGSDLIDTYESAANAAGLTVSGCADNSDNWRVDVRRTDGVWDGDFTLYVKRTFDGEGTGSISGGLSYIEVTTADTIFFSGADDRNAINLQFKLIGMSINVSPTNYNTLITYTVIDIE